jgi:hypothetical protein
VKGKDRVVADNANLGSAIPPELAADCVLRVTSNKRTVLAIVVEVQLAVDRRKNFTWPAYLVGARTRHRCKTMLLVIAPYANVAAWARKAIYLGPGANMIQPHVLGPKEMPIFESEHDARKNPELAVLSAITHGHDADAQRSAALVLRTNAALFRMKHPLSAIYSDLMRAALSDAARKVLAMNPQTYQFFEKKIRSAQIRAMAQGKAEGKAEGKAQGKAEGKAQGKAEGTAAATAGAIIDVFVARGIKITRLQRARILACRDMPTLRRWLAAAAVSKSVTAALSSSRS